MKSGLRRRRGMNDRITANGGICSYIDCNEPRYSKNHGYCVEHRRLIGRTSWRKRRDAKLREQAVSWATPFWKSRQLR